MVQTRRSLCVARRTRSSVGGGTLPDIATQGLGRGLTTKARPPIQEQANGRSAARVSLSPQAVAQETVDDEGTKGAVLEVGGGGYEEGKMEEEAEDTSAGEVGPGRGYETKGAGPRGAMDSDDMSSVGMVEGPAVGDDNGNDAAMQAEDLGVRCEGLAGVSTGPLLMQQRRGENSGDAESDAGTGSSDSSRTVPLTLLGGDRQAEARERALEVGRTAMRQSGHPVYRAIVSTDRVLRAAQGTVELVRDELCIVNEAMQAAIDQSPFGSESHMGSDCDMRDEIARCHDAAAQFLSAADAVKDKAWAAERYAVQEYVHEAEEGGLDSE